MANVKVAISSDFLTAFAKLPRKIQGKVTEFINKFRVNPLAKGINLEKLHKYIDEKLCSVRIDDTYRGIVARHDGSGVYLLLWVDHHDEAYSWAANKKVEVNPHTGGLQVYEVKQITEIQTVKAEDCLFYGINDETLLKLGVPQEQIQYVKSITNINAFYSAKADFASDTFENLSWIVEGIPVSEVLEMLESAGNTNPEGDISKALDKPVSLTSFVIIEGEDELRKILAEPMEKWRVFLHPTQRKIVSKTFNGPARVLGGAGTGKTVVAMHRAKYLAQELKNSGKILFTTFTANLAADIRENLRKICTTEEMRRIEIVNLDAWLNGYLKANNYKFSIIYDESTIDGYWDEAKGLAGNGLPYDIGFYKEEWTKVVVGQNVKTKQEYMKASRRGRGTRIDGKKRLEIWKVFEQYRNLMYVHSVRDVHTAMFECCELLANTVQEPLYDHVIVDEGQDFGPSALKLLRIIAGEERKNDLFIVGDAHQRIYKNKATLSKCGINVKGRSSILRINYRTTEETRKYAFALLKGIPFDDLDEETDIGDKCRSLMHGEKPHVEHFKTIQEEQKFILKEIQQLSENGIPLNDICIVSRTKDIYKDYAEALNTAKIPTYKIKRNKPDEAAYTGIRLATMHRVKGLEFKYVFVVSVNDGIVPLKAAIDHTDAVTEQETLTSEKCLLYVALTRAQRQAYITSYGVASQLIK